MNMHRLKDKSIAAALFAPTILGQKRKANRHGHTFDRTRGRSCHRRRTADQDKAPCPKCNKVHEGECSALRGCFGCGKPGHRVADCPYRNVLELPVDSDNSPKFSGLPATSPELCELTLSLRP
ncbi:hypothetical protein SDJN03_28468, partial [Cucurbita argyrosperma subsp. sororia]